MRFRKGVDFLGALESLGSARWNDKLKLNRLLRWGLELPLFDMPPNAPNDLVFGVLFCQDFAPDHLALVGVFQEHTERTQLGWKATFGEAAFERLSLVVELLCDLAGGLDREGVAVERHSQPASPGAQPAKHSPKLGDRSGQRPICALLVELAAVINQPLTVVDPLVARGLKKSK